MASEVFSLVRRSLFVAASLIPCSVASAAVHIPTVAVGQAGNAASSTGYGSVGYSYAISKYEVTSGQYTEFLNAVAATDTYSLYNENQSGTSSASGITRLGVEGSYTYTVAAGNVNRPVNWVTWGDAARFANWMHNGQPAGSQGAGTTETGAYTLNGAMDSATLLAVTRNPDARWALPTENEWFKAAYYDPTTDSYYAYPTSSNTVPGRSLSDVNGNNANISGSPVQIQAPYYTTEVGQFANSDSPYGTFDQGGNVQEWSEGLFGVNRIVRGGRFNADSGQLLSSYRYYISPLSNSSETGFRLVAIPEPGSVALLAAGAVGLLRRRKTLA